MSKRALDFAIKKWEKVVFEGGEDHGSEDCALCVKYSMKGCGFCPVALETGSPGCSGSPWERWKDHQVLIHRDKKHFMIHDDCHECKELAVEQLSYLKKLRETYKTLTIKYILKQFLKGEQK